MPAMANRAALAETTALDVATTEDVRRLTENIEALRQQISALGRTSDLPPRLAYEVSETCKMLHVGHNTLYQMLGRGQLKSIVINKRKRLITAESIERLLRGDQPPDPAASPAHRRRGRPPKQREPEPEATETPAAA